MIGSTMHCTCGKYEENMVVILGPEWGNSEPNPPEMAVCKNCRLLPPIKTPGLFIQGDTYQGSNRYGVDVSYFEKWMGRITSDMSNYKPDELAREFARMSKCCDDSVLREPEFKGDGK